MIKLKKLSWIKIFFRSFCNKYYSQEGEDIILNEFLGNKNKGFFVDVGAHHPKRFSNTYLFYKKGWNGINIDPMPKSMKLFNIFRKRDINLELGISNNEGTLLYYIFDEPALNGFSKTISVDRAKNTKYKIIGKINIKTYPLKNILEKHVPKGINIDFLSIDVEGLDFEVLESNDWNKYKPTYILIEILGKNLDEIVYDKIYVYLKNLNYNLIAKTSRTCIFKVIEK